MKSVRVLSTCLALFLELASATHGADADATSSETAARGERIAANLRSAERLLAREMRGHPEELMKEEQLLHKAGRMADRGAEAMERVSLLHEEELATRAKMHKAMAKASHLASSKTARTHGATHAMSASEQLASIASTERDLLQSGRQEMDVAQDVKNEVVEAIGESDPRKAAKVEKLMDKVRGEEAAILKSVSEEAKLTGHLAAEKTERDQPLKATIARHPPHRHEASHHPNGGGEVRFLSRGSPADASSAVGLARLTLAEEQAAVHDRHTLRVMQQLTDKAEGALEKNPETAEKFSKLMAMAQRDQRNIAHREMAEALHERRLLHGIAHKHHHDGHGHGGHLLWTRHRHMHAKRRAHDTQRVLAGLREAQSVVGHELGGTEVGKEVHALLEEAKEEEEKVVAVPSVHLTRKPSRITREVQETLQEKLR